MPAAGDGQRGHAGRFPSAPGRAGADPPAAHGAQLRHDEPRLPRPDVHDGGPAALLGRRRRRRAGLPRKTPGTCPCFNSISFFQVFLLHFFGCIKIGWQISVERDLV